MDSQRITFHDVAIEILTKGDEFVGLGQIHIGEKLVRSGRLPMRPYTQTFTGWELCHLRLADVQEQDDSLRICLECRFRRLHIRFMRDHSFDPIHDTADWDQAGEVSAGQLAIVIRPANDCFNGVEFSGFSYAYEYSGSGFPLYWLMDKASWELDGDILGASVFNQSSCSAPVATFETDTTWTTEGVIHWEDSSSKANPVMTHNLPRWASHQAFDYQCKTDATLIGVYERVDLIRSLLCRESGKPELKTFDKHIFDESETYTTSAKAILLSNQPRSRVEQENLWTWVFDEVAERAREEFGLREEPMVPRLSMNYWVNFTIDTYYKDLLPAAVNIGIRSVFVDNLNRSAMSDDGLGNMCCGHEYEPAPSLGGPKKLKEFVTRCAEHGIEPFSWTNNDQAYSSPNNAAERDNRGWYVKMEDTRLKYGGAYTNIFNILDFGEAAPREYWRDCLLATREETGLKAYLFDSFYNLGFMPINYGDCTPTTMWRGTLQAFKELQDADVHFMIESFGPFGEVQHGCPKDYNLDHLFACYKVGMGTGYTTVPTGQEERRAMPFPIADYYRILAHMSRPDHPLFYDGVRIDELFSEEHKAALADFYACHEHMYRRYLQADGKAVLWHDAAGVRATLWNFTARTVALPGQVTDATVGREIPTAPSYELQANHTYVITNVELPTSI